MNESTTQPLIIGTDHSRRFLFGGEIVRFHIINAIRPLWVNTPFARYPMLPDEDLKLVMPDECGTYRVNFTCGEDSVDFTFVVG